MIYYNKLQLKNGDICTLKSPTRNDAAQVLQHMILTSEETDNMLRYPEEFQRPVEAQANFLSQFEASDNAIMIAAFLNGNIVANGSIQPVANVQKCRHRAEFGISIQKKYWGLGIGSSILSAIMEEAKQAGYERIELEVVSTNERAIALYEKFGFHTYGTNPKAFKCKDGTYQDLILMAYEL
ncbi:MAG: GNAT family N-acetyltransferase [Clostridiales bacterium]|nr:GNAT family N-acetyltransferase [Clostridiales bacterium]